MNRPAICDGGTNMKPIALVMTAAALAGLAGCNRTASTTNTASANASNAAAGNAAAAKPAETASTATGNQAAPQTAATSAGAIQLDRTYMLGRWTDNGDCSNAIEFRQDGGFTTANGAQGLWNLEGDRLTMSGGSTLTIRVTPIDQNTITVINADGSLGRSTRC